MPGARKREAEKKAAEARLDEINALANVTELDLRRDEQDLARRLQALRTEMMADPHGTRAVLSRLLEGKVADSGDRDHRDRSIVISWIGDRDHGAERRGELGLGSGAGLLSARGSL